MIATVGILGCAFLTGLLCGSTAFSTSVVTQATALLILVSLSIYLSVKLARELRWNQNAMIRFKRCVHTPTYVWLDVLPFRRGTKLLRLTVLVFSLSIAPVLHTTLLWTSIYAVTKPGILLVAASHFFTCMCVAFIILLLISFKDLIDAPS